MNERMNGMPATLYNPGATLTLKVGGSIWIPIDDNVTGPWSWVAGGAQMTTIYIPTNLAFPPSRLTTSQNSK